MNGVSFQKDKIGVQLSMLQPTILPSEPNSILINLPKRDELLLRMVLALPKASRRGLVWMICDSSLF